MVTFLIIMGLFVITGLLSVRFAGTVDCAAASSASAPDSTRKRSDAPRGLTAFSLLGSYDPVEIAGKLIWRTQIPALRAVCKQPQGVSCATLKPIYVELARRYPEIYDGYTFHDWGQLLVDMGLFYVQHQQIHITPAGRALIERLVGSMPRQNREVAKK